MAIPGIYTDIDPVVSDMQELDRHICWQIQSWASL